MQHSFIYALTSEERVNALRAKNTSFDTDRIFLDRWLNIKGLSNIDDLKVLLNSRKMSLEEFIYSIKPFNDIDIKILSDSLPDHFWYSEVNRILDEYFSSDNDLEKSSHEIGYTIRPFLNDFSMFFKGFINELKSKELTISAEAVSTIVQHISNLLLNNALKVATYDLHVFKNGNNNEGVYEEFLKTKYGTRKSLQDFYYEYPVMTRLIVEKLIAFKHHIKKSISSLVDNLDEIKTKFNIEIAGNTIENVDLGAGDTHNNGQSVMIFTFKNEQKLVYKPKDLELEKCFYKFIAWINHETIKRKDILILPVTDSIYKEDFTLNEYIENYPCSSESEVEEYYKRLGEFLIILYILGGSDFHYENIIACRNMPYIIDTETLFQFNNIIEDVDSAESKIGAETINSVLSLCILPIMGLQQNQEGKGIDISALNAKQQQTPYKILQIKNPNSSEMKFEYDFFEFKDGCSVPTLNGSKIRISKFISSFKQGFICMAQFILENKAEVCSKINEIFGTNVRARQITKATAAYASLLQFFNHPNYLKDMFYLEKLLDNTCVYPYKNKEIYLSEINDLRKGDIPIFYSELNSKNIITSENEKIADYFNKRPIDISLDRINELNYSDIEKQITYISISLSEFDLMNNLAMAEINKIDYTKNGFDNVYDFEKEAISINNIIIESAVWNNKKDDISWYNIEYNQNTISALNLEYLNGLSGLGAYFYVIDRILKNNPLHKEFFNIIKKKTYISDIGYYKKFPQYINNIYLADLENFRSYDTTYIEKRNILSDSIVNLVNDENKSNYYIGMLTCKYNMYKINNSESTLKDMLEFAKLFYSKEYLVCNLLMFNELGLYIKKISDDINDCINRFEQLDVAQIWSNYTNDSYQNGLCGQINILIDLYIITSNRDFLIKASTLANAMVESYKTNKRFRIYEIENHTNMSLNKGLAGIAYTLLRIIYKDKMPNVFSLELKEINI